MEKEDMSLDEVFKEETMQDRSTLKGLADACSVPTCSAALSLSPVSTQDGKGDILEYEEALEACLLGKKRQSVPKKRKAKCQKLKKDNRKQKSKTVRRVAKEKGDPYNLDNIVSMTQGSILHKIVVPQQAIFVPEFHVLDDKYYTQPESGSEDDSDGLYSKIHGPRELAEASGNFLNMGQEVKEEFKEGFIVRLRLR